MRFLRVVMACVFDPLLPGVYLHASCHTLFLGPTVLFYCLLFIYLFLELLFPLLCNASQGIRSVCFHGQTTF